MKDARLQPLLEALQDLSKRHPGQLVIQDAGDYIELAKTHPEPDDPEPAFKWQAQPNCRPATPDDPHPNEQHPVEGYMLVEYRRLTDKYAIGHDRVVQCETVDALLGHIAKRLNQH